MNNGLRKAGMAAVFAMASVCAQAGGNINVVNATDDGIHPWFRYNCWGDPIFSSLAGANGWVNFGGIGAQQDFRWDFTDPALTDPNCKNPKLEFTYTVVPDEAPPAAQPAVYRKLQFSPATNFYMQAGGRIRSYNLLSPENDQ